MSNSKIEKIKKDILGKKYDLSVVFVSKNKIKSLNKKYGRKDAATDVLSFSLSKNCGEILICKEIAKIKAPKFDMTFANYLLFLVIHASFHLKGLIHSSKMERYELTHYNRHRRRYL